MRESSRRAREEAGAARQPHDSSFEKLFVGWPLARTTRTQEGLMSGAVPLARSAGNTAPGKHSSDTSSGMLESSPR